MNDLMRPALYGSYHPMQAGARIPDRADDRRPTSSARSARPATSSRATASCPSSTQGELLCDRRGRRLRLRRWRRTTTRARAPPRCSSRGDTYTVIRTRETYEQLVANEKLALSLISWRPCAWSGVCARRAALAACGDNARGRRPPGRRHHRRRSHARRVSPARREPVDDERATFQAGRSPFDFSWDAAAARPAVQQQRVPRLSRRQRPRAVADRRRADRSQALVRVSLPTATPDVPGGPVPVPGLRHAAPGSRDGRPARGVRRR